MKKVNHYTLNLIVGLFQIFNHKFLMYLGSLLGTFFYYVIPLRKKVVIKNLKIAFPDKSYKEIKNLSKKCYISICKTFLEIIHLKKIKREWFSKNVIIENEELVIKHLNEEKSLIFLTAHFGNWEFGALSFGIKYNISMNVLAKRQSNESVTNFMSLVRTQFGNKEIFTGSSVKELYKALLNNEKIGVVGDQRGSKQGPRVNYFNTPTAFYQGTAQLALKTKTPILVVLVARQPNNTYIAHAEELSLENLPESIDEKIIEINQRYFKILEKRINQYPEQWFWMHNIWKY